MFSRPYQHGEYWRIDIIYHTGKRKYIEFESYVEAWHWYIELINNEKNE